MKRKRNIYKVFMLLLCCFCLNARGAERPIEQLSSLDEISQKYVRWHEITETPIGIEYFIGRPKMSPTDVIRDKGKLLKFDKNTLQVSSVLSEEQYARLLEGPKGIMEIAADPRGTTISVTLELERPPAGGREIVLINADTGDFQELVNDGRINHGPVFSPDGRYIAYYSTNAKLFAPDRREPLDQNAGRVVNISTKEIKEYVSPYIVITTQWLRLGQPVWLGQHRVSFGNYTSDRVVDENKGLVPGDRRYYVAVANVETDEVKRLFIAGDFPITVIVDAAQERLIFHNLSRIVRTDYDLNDPEELVAVGPDQKVGQVKLENGELKYKIWDK